TTAPALIRQTYLGHSSLREFLRLLPAGFVSIIFNVSIVLLLFLLSGPSQAVPPPLEDAKEESVVQAAAPEENKSSDPLLVTDVDPAAVEPAQEINYNVDRKDRVPVPGIVNPDEPTGILGGDKNAPPMPLPAPYGIGGGQGGALEAIGPGSHDAPGM